MLRNYTATGEAGLARLLADLAPSEAAWADLDALARTIWILIDGIGTTSAINPGTLSVDQQRAVLGAAVKG